MKYKLGDTVRLRTWEELRQEFGWDDDGDLFIDNRYVFGNKRHLFGRQATVEKAAKDKINGMLYLVKVIDKNGLPHEEVVTESLLCNDLVCEIPAPSLSFEDLFTR